MIEYNSQDDGAFKKLTKLMIYVLTEEISWATVDLLLNLHNNAGQHMT